MNGYRCISERLGTLPVPVFGAHSFLDRLRGLMFRDAAGFALWLRPCSSVHTFGMQFPIHILFLDEEGQIIKVVCEVPQSRASFCKIACSVLEIPSSLIHGSELPPVGDYLSFRYGYFPHCVSSVRPLRTR